jgi:hypothetical protein
LQIIMHSVGPFELTEAEFFGMQILWRKDEKQLEKMTSGAAHISRLIAKLDDALAALTTLESIRFEGSQKNRSSSPLRSVVSLETGESGETAEVEAESELIRRDLELFRHE